LPTVPRVQNKFCWYVNNLTRWGDDVRLVPQSESTFSHERESHGFNGDRLPDVCTDAKCRAFKQDQSKFFDYGCGFAGFCDIDAHALSPGSYWTSFRSADLLLLCRVSDGPYADFGPSPRSRTLPGGVVWLGHLLVDPSLAPSLRTEVGERVNATLICTQLAAEERSLVIGVGVNQHAKRSRIPRQCPPGQQRLAVALYSWK
jgi:hypothetical protein